MDRTGLGRLLEDERLNAVLAWVLVGSVLLGAGRSFLRGDLLWCAFALVVVVVALLPPVLDRDSQRMMPWEILALAALPVLGRAFFRTQVSGFASYIAIAALALVVAVELHVFTDVEMTPGFAVGFVVIATIATAGLWALVRWIANGVLETGFLASEEALMWEFVASTVAGIVAGFVFAWYLRRRTDAGRGEEGTARGDRARGTGTPTESGE